MRLLAPAIAVITLAACGPSNDPTDGKSSTAASSQTSSQETESAFSHEDIMFAQAMIPHHQQAIDMSNLALKNSQSARVQGLAQRIKSAQTTEIATLRKWIDDSGMGDSHAGDHGSMSGMLSKEEMSALAAAQGPAFDKLFLKGMIKHHEGAIDMAAAVTESENREVSDFANWMRSTQYNEITEMTVVFSQIP